MSENHFMSEEIKRLTDKINKIAEDMEYEKDEDNILTLGFQAVVLMEQIRRLIKGLPIVRYDYELKKPYILYPNGRREYEL